MPTDLHRMTAYVSLVHMHALSIFWNRIPVTAFVMASCCFGCSSTVSGPTAQPRTGGNGKQPDTLKISGVSDTERQAIAKALGTGPPTTEPTLRPGLLIDVMVTAAGIKEYDEKRVRVTQTGTVSLPLINSVKVQGLTLSKLTDFLTKEYDRFLRRHVVKVTFSDDQDESPWGYVAVLGRVNKPGRVPIGPTGWIPLMTAIQEAGGFAARANKKAILVTRKRADGPPVTHEVNLESAAKLGGALGEKLRASAVVYVKSTIL